MTTMRTVEFPGEGLPGTVHFLAVPSDGEVIQGEIEPRGRVDLPAGAELILVAEGDPAAEGRLDALASMPADTFMQLELTGVGDHALGTIGRMTGVVLLSLTGTFTDAGLTALAGLRDLQTLVLESPNITGRLPLPEAPITDLCLGGNGLTDEVFETIAALPLVNLSVSGDSITGQGLSALHRATRLQAISLMGVALRPYTLRRLAGLPCLETLSVIPSIVDEPLADALLGLIPPLAEVDLAPQYGELDPTVVARLLSAGLVVNGVLAPPQAAATFAEALSDHARDTREHGSRAEPVPGPEPEIEPRATLLTITRQDDLDLLLDQPSPVLVHCTAAWCRPCARLEPVLEEILVALNDSVAGVSVDVDQVPWATGRFAVQNVPTLLLLRQHEELLRLVGAHPKRQIEKMIAAVLP